MKKIDFSNCKIPNCTKTLKPNKRYRYGVFDCSDNYFKNYLFSVEQKLQFFNVDKEVWKALVPIDLTHDVPLFAEVATPLTESLSKSKPYTKEWLHNFELLTLAKIAALSHIGLHSKRLKARTKCALTIERLLGACISAQEILLWAKERGRSGGVKKLKKKGPLKQLIAAVCDQLRDPNLNNTLNLMESKRQPRSIADKIIDLGISHISVKYFDDATPNKGILQYSIGGKQYEVQFKTIQNYISEAKKSRRKKMNRPRT